MRDNKYLTKIVYACLLGDASVMKDKRYVNTNVWFSQSQIVDHIDYLENLQNILQDVTVMKIHKAREALEHVWIVDRFCNSKELWNLYSKRHPFFNSFRERCYLEGRKVIDVHGLKLMDWEMMSIFYMDDGYLENTTTVNHQGKRYNLDTLGLCTQSYSYGDQVLLKRAIEEKLGVVFNIRPQRNQLGNLKYRMFLRGKDIPKFICGVEKFILPSFQYKLNLTGIEHLKEYDDISRMEIPATAGEDIV